MKAMVGGLGLLLFFAALFGALKVSNNATWGEVAIGVLIGLAAAAWAVGSCVLLVEGLQ